MRCYPAVLQERGISIALIERKGLLSYQDGFGGRKLGLVVKVGEVCSLHGSYGFS